MTNRIIAAYHLEARPPVVHGTTPNPSLTVMETDDHIACRNVSTTPTFQR